MYPLIILILKTAVLCALILYWKLRKNWKVNWNATLSNRNAQTSWQSWRLENYLIFLMYLKTPNLLHLQVGSLIAMSKSSLKSLLIAYVKGKKQHFWLWTISIVSESLLLMEKSSASSPSKITFEACSCITARKQKIWRISYSHYRSQPK